MKTTPIVPARIVVDDDGTPRSVEYDDVYHPRSGALAQARHVFLDGDALAARWRGKDRFVVLETGFGLGNNFLATWAAWRADPKRCRQLHFISI
jgi:tRNA 5-methylaminomethyl-2-thiouridine biosynthesis bifunctional protein